MGKKQDINVTKIEYMNLVHRHLDLENKKMAWKAIVKLPVFTLTASVFDPSYTLFKMQTCDYEFYQIQIPIRLVGIFQIFKYKYDLFLSYHYFISLSAGRVSV